MTTETSIPKAVQISVRRLVDFAMRSGDLRLDGPLIPSFGGSSGPVASIRLHQKIQKLRHREDEGYQAEVPIQGIVEMHGFRVQLNGRMDGVLPNRMPPLVEEIKTTRRTLHSLRADHPAHWAQLQAYGYLIAEQAALDQVVLRLTYAHLDDATTREFQRTVSREELTFTIRNAVAKLTRWYQRLAAWREDRDASIQELAFPYPHFRPGQRALAVSVFHTAKHGDQLFLEAPTGTGKTAASLFPTLKAIGEKHRSSIVYLTARTTGKAPVEQALANLHSKGLVASSLTLTAKESICFNPDRACNGDECQFARGYYDRVERARDSLFDGIALTQPRVESLAREHQVCPFELSHDLASWVDVLICDYNYAFHPHNHLRRLFGEETEVLRADRDTVWIIDEAHQLVERGRDMFSASIHVAPFRQLRELLGVTNGRLKQSVDAVHRWLSRHANVDDVEDAPDRTMLEPLLSLLRRFVHRAATWHHDERASGLASPELRQSVITCCLDSIGFLRTALRESPKTEVLLAEDNRDPGIKLFCVDPAPGLRQALSKSESAIFCSATLQPRTYFEQSIGTESPTRWSTSVSPFPEDNLCVLVADYVSTRFRHRAAGMDEVVSLLKAFTSAKPGNYLVFLPSFRYLEDVSTHFAGMHPDIGLQRQEPLMSGIAKRDFLRRITAKNPTQLVSFAVLGGIFAEGIDLPGGVLSGAAVIGVGLPGVNPEREAIRAYYDTGERDGFHYAYVYPGVQRVLQAAGRVIRTDADRGAVMLVGERFRRSPYRQMLPTHWRPERVRSPQAVSDRLEVFWRAKRGDMVAELRRTKCAPMTE